MAGTLQLGGITVLEESGGTVTAPNNLSVTGTISGTIGSTTTFPAELVCTEIRRCNFRRSGCPSDAAIEKQ